MKKEITVPIAWIEKMVKLKNEIVDSKDKFDELEFSVKLAFLIGYLQSLEEMAKE